MQKCAVRNRRKKNHAGRHEKKTLILALRCRSQTKDAPGSCAYGNEDEAIRSKQEIEEAFPGIDVIVKIPLSLSA